MEKNVVKAEMLRILQNKLQEFVKDPKPIKVALKEYEDIDLFEKVDKRTMKVTKEQYEQELHNKGAQPLGEIEFTKDTSYLAFHDLAWKELTMEQKVIAALWFNKLQGEINNRPSIFVMLDGYNESMMKYVYIEKKDTFALIINPFLLNISTEYFGGYVLHNLMQINMQENLNVALDNIRGLNYDYKFDIITLANFLKPYEKPDYLNAFHYEIDALNEEEKKQALLFLTQPVEYSFRKAFELTCEYMQQGQEIIELPDYVWDRYKELTIFENKQVDTMAEKLFKKGEKEQFFKDYLKDEVSDINFYIKHQEKER